MAQNTGDDFKKNTAFPEGNRLFAGDFVLIWMKQTLIWFNLQRDGTGNVLTPRIHLQKVCNNKYQFCTKVCTSSRLVSHVHMMAKQNIKKKYLMCQIPIKMMKQHAIPNSSLHNLKIYSSKGCKKASQST